MQEKLTVVLMFKLLEVIRESGANRTEAACAINAAAAMIPDLDLAVKPTLEIQTPY